MYPPLALCTDNAAMIAAAGHFRYASGFRSALDLDVATNIPGSDWL
jgi:N6-L-threonylcarbamoyladenine synthase